MEMGEKGCYQYSKLISEVPEAKVILQEEEEHEEALIGMLDEEGSGM